jgi:hypothetical protein
MRRRQFLITTAATTLATQIPSTLAAQPSRKLALLVGINSYPDGIPNLKGCLNDLELQRNLLIHRLGFLPQDILTLTNQAATRAAIIQAFEIHLIGQANPNDIVLFHFSGHGVRVQDPEPIDEDGLNGAIAPYDYGDPKGAIVNPIMGKTLFLLLSALKTDSVTTVLDCCHSGGGLRDDTPVRTIDDRRGPSFPQASRAETQDQERWLKTLGWNKPELQNRRRQGHAKGIGLGSTGRNQLAADAPFDDFHAGAFTYLLTRHLWQTAPNVSLKTSFEQLALQTKTLAKAARIFQDPTYISQDARLALRPLYFTNPNRPTAEATVRQTTGNQVEFWLGGIAPQSLSAFTQGANFTLLDDRGQTIGEIEQTGRSGLIGYGQIQSGKARSGTLMREQIRGIPANLSLALGLDASLTSAKSQVQQALEPFGRLKLSTPADHWLFRNASGAIGLNLPDNTALTGSLGPSGESIPKAIQRLQLQFQSLLAAQMLRKIAQSTTQGLKLLATIQTPGGRGSDRRKFAPGQQIAIEITNPNDQPLHIAIVAIDGDGSLTILAPTDWEATEPPPPLLPHQSTIIPTPGGLFLFRLQPPEGLLEILVLGSTTSLMDPLKGLRQIARGSQTRSGNPLTLQADQPVAIVDQLFTGLGNLGIDRRQNTTYRMDNRQLTSLSITIEVAEAM